jgi:hypothetical protein
MPYVGVIITAFKLLDQLVKEDKQGIMIELWERVMEQNRELQKSVRWTLQKANAVVLAFRLPV